MSVRPKEGHPSTMTTDENSSRVGKKRRTFFAFFAALSVMAATIGALTAALLRAEGMEVLKTAGITFCSTLGLLMTAYLFLAKDA